MTTSAWGILLTIAALAAIGFQIHRWRRQQVTVLQFAAGLVARAGFVLLGIIYATNMVDTRPRAPLYGLGIVGIGIVLNLTAGIIENIRRARSR